MMISVALCGRAHGMGSDMRFICMDVLPEHWGCVFTPDCHKQTTERLRREFREKPFPRGRHTQGERHLPTPSHVTQPSLSGLSSDDEVTMVPQWRKAVTIQSFCPHHGSGSGLLTEVFLILLLHILHVVLCAPLLLGQVHWKLQGQKKEKVLGRGLTVGKTLLSNLDDLSSDPWNPSQNPDMVTCIGIPGTPVARWGRGRHRRTAWMFMRQLIQGTQCKGRNKTLPLIR